jgi:3-methyladenine DNA glycosylase Tag
LQDYELRQFEDMNWVRTRVKIDANPASTRFWKEVEEGVEKIADYFAGENADGKSIPSN